MPQILNKILNLEQVIFFHRLEYELNITKWLNGLKEINIDIWFIVIPNKYIILVLMIYVKHDITIKVVM